MDNKQEEIDMELKEIIVEPSITKDIVLPQKTKDKVSLEELNQLKDKLEKIGQAMQHKSYFDAFVFYYWGPVFWPLKIFLALVLIPPIIAAIITLSIIPFILATAVFLTYVIGGLIFEDHYRNSSEYSTEQMEGVYSLAELFAQVVNTIDAVGQDFRTTVDSLKEKNDLLNQQLGELDGHINSIKSEVENLGTTDKDLQEHTNNLGDTAKDIKETIRLKKELLNQTLNELNKLKESYITQQNELNQKIEDLNTYSNQQKVINLQLTGFLVESSSQSLRNKDEQDIFLNKLKEFVNGSGSRFDDFFNVLKKTQSDLDMRTEELKKNNELYVVLNECSFELLKLQGTQIKEIKQIKDEYKNEHTENNTQIENKQFVIDESLFNCLNKLSKFSPNKKLINPKSNESDLNDDNPNQIVLV
jgi:FtsZ-binding cell division protein ZapB